jgi:hypothetical protein
MELVSYQINKNEMGGTFGKETGKRNACEKLVGKLETRNIS